MLKGAEWITHPHNVLYAPICFIKNFNLKGKVKRATLNITALGVYYAELNGERVGNFTVLFRDYWEIIKTL